jgi:hypothetical protein
MSEGKKKLHVKIVLGALAVLAAMIVWVLATSIPPR